MKKLLSLLLACILLLSTVWLTACDELSFNLPSNESEEPPKDSQSEGGTSEPPSDSTPQGNQSGSGTASSVPVKVGVVSGMTAKQVVEKFAEEYTTAKTYDICATMTTVLMMESDKEIRESVELKLGEDSMYFNMDTEDLKMEYWIVDDVMYMNTDGEKIKVPNVDFEERLSSLDLGEMFADCFDQLESDLYVEKLESAQIYYFAKEYYFTVTFTAQEARENGLGDEALSETVYFNSLGKVKKIITETSSERSIALLNSYGSPVTVTAPADAEEYEEQTGGGSTSGENDHELYAQYLQLMETLDTATVYFMSMAIDGEDVLLYETDGMGAHVSVNEDGDVYQTWYVNDKGYVSRNDEDPIETPVTEDFLMGFESTAYEKTQMAFPIDGTDMTNLCMEIEGDLTTISFTHVITEDTADCYAISFDSEVTAISFVVLSVMDGEPYSTMVCNFTDINSTTLRVTAPSVG